MLTESSSQNPEEQLVLACAELRQRLGAGESCCAEELLARFPALAAREDLAVDLVLAEWSLRRGRGEEPPTEEWGRRFPQWADRLRQRLETDGGSPATLRLGVEPSTPTVADQCAAAQRPPRAFGRYELLDELGHGGMGRVFKARDTVLGRLVALKVLRAGIAAHPEELYRFHREAQAIARLRHRHIIPVYDLGELDGQPYLTMAYLPGGTLAQHRERFAGDVRAAVALVEKVARAVQAAHEQGIVHRDLKPGNVLLDEAGEPLVSDFGLAKLLGAGDEVTQTGQILGTPAYMAPEQAAGQGHEVTPASDVWALGVLLYELLTGKRPFEGKGAELTRRVQSEEPAAPRRVKPALDRDLEAIVLKCLEKDPRRRYRSGAALADDLAHWLHGEPAEAQPVSWAGRTYRGVFRRFGRMGAAVLLLVAIVSGLVLLGPRLGIGPDRGQSALEKAQATALAEYERDLAAGRPVTLLGEKGLPRYYRWRTQTQRPPFALQGPVPLEVESYPTGLLDLLPDPMTTAYRLSVEVGLDRHSMTSAGVYCLAEERARPAGPEQVFLALRFAVAGKEGGRAELNLFHYREAGERLGAANDQYTLAVVPLGPGPWHALTVEVVGARIHAACDQQPFPAVDLARDRGQVQTWWNGLGLGTEPPPALSPRSPFGLFVFRGTASFKNFVVTPLDAGPAR